MPMALSPLLDLWPVPDDPHLQRAQGFWKVCVPASPVVNRLRKRQAQSVSDFGRANQVFRTKLSRHGPNLGPRPTGGWDRSRARTKVPVDRLCRSAVVCVDTARHTGHRDERTSFNP